MTGLLEEKPVPSSVGVAWHSLPVERGGGDDQSFHYEVQLYEERRQVIVSEAGELVETPACLVA